MKKLQRITAATLMVVLCAALIAGCGGDTKLSGKYYLSSMEEDGEVLNVSELADLGVDFSDTYLEFSGDKITVCTYGESETCTYKIDGKNIEFTSDGETLKGTIDGDKITLDVGDGTKMIYEKK